MIRIATLLPAFTLAIALASTGVAFAAGGTSHAAGRTTQHTTQHSQDQNAAYKNACADENSSAYSCNLQSPHGR